MGSSEVQVSLRPEFYAVQLGFEQVSCPATPEVRGECSQRFSRRRTITAGMCCD
jgi:hypothetical protein